MQASKSFSVPRSKKFLHPAGRHGRSERREARHAAGPADDWMAELSPEWDEKARRDVGGYEGSEEVDQLRAAAVLRKAPSESRGGRRSRLFKNRKVSSAASRERERSAPERTEDTKGAEHEFESEVDETKGTRKPLFGSVRARLRRYTRGKWAEKAEAPTITTEITMEAADEEKATEPSKAKTRPAPVLALRRRRSARRDSQRAQQRGSASSRSLGWPADLNHSAKEIITIEPERDAELQRELRAEEEAEEKESLHCLFGDSHGEQERTGGVEEEEEDLGEDKERSEQGVGPGISELPRRKEDGKHRKKATDRAKTEPKEGGKFHFQHTKEDKQTMKQKTEEGETEMTQSGEAQGSVALRKVVKARVAARSKTHQATECAGNAAGQFITRGEQKFYTFKELQSPIVGVDWARRETYLSDEEFFTVFGMTKEEFGTLRRWQVTRAKIAAGIF